MHSTLSNFDSALSDFPHSIDKKSLRKSRSMPLQSINFPGEDWVIDPAPPSTLYRRPSCHYTSERASEDIQADIAERVSQWQDLPVDKRERTSLSPVVRKSVEEEELKKLALAKLLSENFANTHRVGRKSPPEPIDWHIPEWDQSRATFFEDDPPVSPKTQVGNLDF